MQTLPNAAFKNVPTTFKKSATTALHCLRSPPVKLTCSEHRLRLRSERVFCNQKCAMTVCTALVSFTLSRLFFSCYRHGKPRERRTRMCIASSSIYCSGVFLHLFKQLASPKGQEPTPINDAVFHMEKIPPPKCSHRSEKSGFPSLQKCLYVCHAYFRVASAVTN